MTFKTFLSPLKGKFKALPRKKQKKKGKCLARHDSVNFGSHFCFSLNLQMKMLIGLSHILVILSFIVLV